MSSSTNTNTPSEAEQASPGSSSIFPVLTPYYAELLAVLKSLMDTVVRNKCCGAARVKEIKESLGAFAEKYYLPRGLLRRLDDVLGVLVSMIPANAAKWNVEAEKLPGFTRKYDSLCYNAHVAYMEPWKESTMAVIPLLVLACETHGHLKEFESGTGKQGKQTSRTCSLARARPPALLYYVLSGWKHHEATFIKLREEIGLLAEAKTFNDCREALGLPRVKG
ncbi:hypothetical protein DL769_003004 [Monosporascus sp. CRB-8-3]|nr:hypothetical protein DL769_003004 [Monosporascus sp. CRB-8-3]